jgi:nucleoside 2-deoxyribosyltransferase
VRIYLASRFENRPKLIQARSALEESGHVVTSRWLEVTDRPIPSEDSSQWAAHAALWSEYDLEDVASADLLICDLTCEVQGMRGGVHVEVGYALGQGKPVWVIGRRPNVFFFSRRLRDFEDWDGVFREVSR